MVWEEQRAEGVEVTSYPTFEDWRARAHAFEILAAARVWRPTLRTADGPVRLQGAEVSLDFFPTLGVVPALGRLLQPEDFRPDATPVVVLGQRLWRQRFGADPSVLGRAVSLEGRRGRAQPGYFASSARAWAIASSSSTTRSGTGGRSTTRRSSWRASAARAGWYCSRASARKTAFSG
jgi:hypothetical protein